ncbi:MAG: PilZ domain-containing protein [Nannocystaceae bacterium]
MRKIRCHYPSAEAYISALEPNSEPQSLQVFSTDPFEPGEEVLLEVYFAGLPGKMMVRAIGKEWHSARPRLRVRAGGVLRCTGTEWRKLEFLRDVGSGAIDLTARRRHVRLPVMVEVRWRRQNSTEYAMAALSEISEGGALLLTRSPPSQAEDIIVEITPPGSERALEVLAVVRTANNPDGEGLEFLARDMGGVHRLREVIRRLVEQ